MFDLVLVDDEIVKFIFAVCNCCFVAGYVLEYKFDGNTWNSWER